MIYGLHDFYAYSNQLFKFFEFFAWPIFEFFAWPIFEFFAWPIFKFFADRFSKCSFRILNAKLPIFSEAKLSFYDVVVFTTNLVYTFPDNLGFPH
jgi:hypothetical protein